MLDVGVAEGTLCHLPGLGADGKRTLVWVGFELDGCHEILTTLSITRTAHLRKANGKGWDQSGKPR